MLLLFSKRWTHSSLKRLPSVPKFGLPSDKIQTIGVHFTPSNLSGQHGWPNNNKIRPSILNVPQITYGLNNMGLSFHKAQIIDTKTCGRGFLSLKRSDKRPGQWRPLVPFTMSPSLNGGPLAESQLGSHVRSLGSTCSPKYNTVATDEDSLPPLTTHSSWKRKNDQHGSSAKLWERADLRVVSSWPPRLPLCRMSACKTSTHSGVSQSNPGMSQPQTDVWSKVTKQTFT